MEKTDDNSQLPTIQLLITSCPKVADSNTRYAWLHGYCLLTYSQVGDSVHLDGQLRIGQPYVDDGSFIAGLTQALDPGACLAGLDLHDLVSCLSGLPIGARDQKPALALLLRLRRMLHAQAPIDLALGQDHTTAVASRALELASCYDAPVGDDRGGQPAGGAPLSSNFDNGNPNQLAQDLAEAASIAILALGDFYVPDELRPQLEAKWRAWRHSLAPSVPMPKPTLQIVSND
jgi:hypothetical protein